MAYPIKITEPDRSPAVLFWPISAAIAIALPFAWQALESIETSQMISAGIAVLIVFVAVWQLAGLWWLPPILFTSPLFLIFPESQPFDLLPLLGIALYAHFVSQAAYVDDEPVPNDRPMQRFAIEAGALVLILLKPHLAGLAAIPVWLRSDKKWWLAGIIVAMLALFVTVAVTDFAGLRPLFVAPSFTIIDYWPLRIIAGIILLWISIGQRDILIGAISTLLFWNSLPDAGLSMFIVLLFVRLPALAFPLSFIAWLLVATIF